MKFRRLLLALFALAGSAAAQFTVVTGTVTDPNGLAYANGTIVSTLVTSASPTLSGLPYSPPSGPTQLDGSGKFTIRLGDNSVLSPGGTQWTFLICSGTGTVQPAGGKGPVCFTVPALTISGSSQSITSNITAVPPPALTVNAGTGTVTSVACTSPESCSPSPIVGSGTISCPTCAIGPGASTANHVAEFSGTDGLTLKDGGAAGSGTVTNTSGSLTSGDFIFGNGGADIKDAGFSVVPPASGGAGKCTINGDCYLLLPTVGDFTQGAGNTASGGAGGTLRCGLMEVPYATVFTKMDVNVVTASNTNHIYLGVYTKDRGTLLVQGTITMTAATGIYTATVSSTTLTPDAYWYCFSTDNATIAMQGSSGWNTVALTVMNANNVAWGLAANTLSGGTLPASLGTMTANNAVLPLTKLEP